MGSNMRRIDCVMADARLPALEVGSWLYFTDMGAYTACAGSNFNGMSLPDVMYLQARGAAAARPSARKPQAHAAPADGRWHHARTEAERSGRWSHAAHASALAARRVRMRARPTTRGQRGRGGTGRGGEGNRREDSLLNGERGRQADTELSQTWRARLGALGLQLRCVGDTRRGVRERVALSPWCLG